MALKEIKPQHAGNKNSQQRFLVEGEVTGSLEHPGIVPVYGMGRYTDGRPYYAMRFVHGESLEEAIDQFHHPRAVRPEKTALDVGPDDATIEASAHAAASPNDNDVRSDNGKLTTDQASQRSLAFRELLSRFIAVCNAIAYAHSRGVLHRDLKPGNILLAKFGETLVVDWGLAKVAGQTDDIDPLADADRLELQSGTGSAPTRFGSVIGTPAYMSPEQAEGRTDLMGPASDIYSLGATLYALLTGRSPFMDPRLDQVLANVRAGRFPRPRQVNPEVPRPLEAVCLKAMSLRLVDRYQSATVLADDLEHWLADEPVSAYPEPGLKRAARWVRRHKSAALSTAIGLLLLTVIAITAAVLVNRQRVIADEARRSADIAFRQARDAVDDLFTDVSEDSLLNSPGMQGLRRSLLEKTLRYYEQFLAQRTDDPSLKEELAATHFRAGRIIDDLQSPEKAVPYFETARDIQTRLLAESPQDPRRIHALGDTENALGRSLHRGQHFEAALEEYRKARELRQQLVERQPSDQEYLRSLASSVMNIGIAEKDLGRLDAALADLQAAQQLREKQLGVQESFKLRRDLAMGLYNLGILELKRDKSEQALQYFSDASAAFEQLQSADPRDLTISNLLGICYRISAESLAKNGKPAEAAELFQKSCDVFTHLVDRNPEVGEYRAALARVYMNMAPGQELAAAKTTLEQSQQLLDGLIEQYPLNPQFKADQAATIRELGIVQMQLGDLDRGRQNLESSVEALEKLHAEFPGNEDFNQQLQRSREKLREASLGIPTQTA